MKKIIAIVMFGLLCGISYAKDFTIDSFHAPAQYVNKAQGDEFTLTDPVIWVEVCHGEDILNRTDGQSFGGNKSSFYFSREVNIADDKFPIIVKILVGEKEDLERVARAAAGGGIGATVGGIIGGCLAGFVSGGLGAPAGAAIGIAIGGAVGAGASLLAPVRGAREVSSFYFESPQEIIGEHKKPCGNDILSDGQEAKLVIKE